MEKSYSEPEQARNRGQRNSQRNIYGSSPFLDPIIIKECTSLDELHVNRANKEAKIFRA